MSARLVFVAPVKTTVGSTGGGNTSLKTLSGRLIFERFPWPFVELASDGTQLGLAV